MLKNITFSGLFCSFFVSPLQAQQLSTLEVWNRFQSTCRQVFLDPNAFMASLTIPAASGDRVLSVSPDSKAISIYRREHNVYDEIQFHVIGNRQIRDCSVIGEFYDLNTSEIASQLLNIASSTGSATISGGHAPQDYDGETVEEIYLFAIDGLFPNANLISVAHVIDGELQLLVQQPIN
ncbi:hypothetical protein J7399_11210 [Shimia sp. R9_1]|uniref:hypothetical protein n=1 Tax=Shimia sp. R9_1 TaxID=2821111 RepID=UPI001ADA1613|nr:hypothetical protein [Shimia sp. R9_1]MBO9407999.1 hypothetical protein [Shimia sp. R9_1]